MRGTLLCAFWLLAQISWTQERCATNSLTSNSQRAETTDQFEDWLKNQAQEQRQLSSSYSEAQQIIYQVPIVFHIIHDGSTVGRGTNISDAKILEQVDILNADFRRTNTDADNTPEAFRSVASDMEIEFVLAKQDPEGLPTDGIVRVRGSKDIYRPLTDNVLLKSESFWDQDKYVNIYITDLDNFLGAAQFPFSNIAGSEVVNYKSTDGVMIDYQWVGVNTSTGGFDSYGRTLTHEMGHYLGLKHIWGDGGCGFDDFCEDTPESQNSTNGCPTNKESCGSADMIQNYMDYTDDVCMNLFTECQKTRMRTVLQMSPRRASLLTSAGLTEPIIVANDLGIRSIISPRQASCETLVTPSVQIRNYGLNEINSFQVGLYVNGSLVQTISNENQLAIGATAQLMYDPISLNENEADNVSFSVLEVNGSIDGKLSNDTKTVEITPFASLAIPFLEDFEDEQIIYSYTENGEPSKWVKSVAAKSQLNNEAILLPFFNQTENYGYRDIFLTKTLDFSALTSVQLDFAYSYAGRSSRETDGLLVAVSRNCGADFSRDDIVFERYGTSLRTTSNTDSEYIPSNESQWENVNINLTRYTGLDQVQIAFMGVNAGGNNIYLDDISVNSANLLAYDIGIRSVEDLPIVSCEPYSRAKVEVKNFGFETINTLEIITSVNGVASTLFYNNLNLRSGRSEIITIDQSDELTGGVTELSYTIGNINGRVDMFEGNNEWRHIGIVEETEELIPIREDFDPLGWTISNPQGVAFWEVERLDRNYVLASKSFGNDTIGQSFLVTPTILTGNYRQGGIRFDYAYARRLGFNDNLKVLLSVNCGKTYDIELLSINSEQLATKLSGEEFVPEPEDWKKIFIDLTEHMIWPELRVAIAFTNGNGNKLYLDDIDILTTNDPDLPEFENPVVLYPNPAFRSFNVALNLQNKQTIQVRLMDMSGRVVFDKPFANSINQTLRFEAPSQSGFYMLQVTGENNLNQIKRLFIKR